MIYRKRGIKNGYKVIRDDWSCRPNDKPKYVAAQLAHRKELVDALDLYDDWEHLNCVCSWGDPEVDRLEVVTMVRILHSGA